MGFSSRKITQRTFSDHNAEFKNVEFKKLDTKEHI